MAQKGTLSCHQINFLFVQKSQVITIKICCFFANSIFGFFATAFRHGLRTPNEGINQRYLKNWADVADKICCRHT